MIIYTSNINYKPTDQTLPLIDTTVKSGTGIGAAFAPTWDMVLAVSDRGNDANLTPLYIRIMKERYGYAPREVPTKITWEQYTTLYTELMRSRYKADPKPFIDAANTPVLCLQCYCATEKHTRCHRSLLADILVKIARSRGLSAVYAGELPMDETRHIMICGSRHASYELMQKSRDYVYQLPDKHEGKVHIHVGDALGIDANVIDQAYWDSVPCTVYGVQDKPRAIVPATTPYINVGGSYTTRDRLMVNLADEVVAFWDGKSKGTAASIDYAHQLGIPVTVIS